MLSSQLLVAICFVLATTKQTTAQPRSCLAGEFMCRAGRTACIPDTRRCDGRSDCEDASDELDCSRPCDRDSELDCGDNTCISIRYRCDGRLDCPNRSDIDERDCASDIRVTATPTRLSVYEGEVARFSCNAYCPPSIPCVTVWGYRSPEQPLPTGVFDRGADLMIQSAELRQSGQYYCTVRGYSTASFGVVELNVDPAVTPPVILECQAGEYTCRNGRCVDRRVLCNGQDECGDNSDEQNCVAEKGACEPPEYKCNNDRCVQKIWRCDGDDDCRDGSDEDISFCPVKLPGDTCGPYEEQCADRTQCIPRAFLCDGQIDCVDQSDEIGCSDPTVIQAPVPTITVSIGGTIQITCRAIGKPIPLISWRLNWGPIPIGARVTETSEDGYGVLIIRDARLSDAGAYTCEAINNQNAKFANPDAIVTVTVIGVSCAGGTFNSEARTLADCLDCYCFGVTDSCTSSGQYMQQAEFGGASLRVGYENGREITPPISIYDTVSQEASIPFFQLSAPADVNIYWILPSADIAGNQLDSYGGIMRYTTRYEDGPRAEQASRKEVIIKGTSSEVYCTPGGSFTSGEWRNVELQVIAENCQIERRSSRGDLGIPAMYPASRDDLMMILNDVQAVLIRASLSDQQRSVSIKDLSIETAGLRPNNVPANLVERCSCPVGYTGKSCEDCAAGYERRADARFPLGICVRIQVDECDRMGTQRTMPDGRCDCKQFTTGNRCDQCMAGTFYMSLVNLNGCQECFCMGVTSNCDSTSQRIQVRTADTRSINEWALTEENGLDLVQNVLIPNNDELVIRLGDLGELTEGSYYAKLPSFKGNLLGAYGGSLKFNLKFVAPRPTAPLNAIPEDIIMFGGSGIQLSAAYRIEQRDLDARELSISIPFTEPNWRRADGAQTTHEHMLMALADVDFFLVKLSITVDTEEVRLSRVSLDVADPRAPSSSVRAWPVEECVCPSGYIGLSCEECAPGYTRAPGVYLGICVGCECNGHSNDCDENTGSCLNCRHGTTGRFCEQCEPGYVRNARDDSPFECLNPTVIVTIDEPTITVTVGGRAELVCRPYDPSLPISSIDWRRADNQPLPRNAIQRDGRLILENVQTRDDGNYICIVTTRGNVRGEGIATLVVRTIPACPEGYTNPPRCDECVVGYTKDRFGRCNLTPTVLSVVVTPDRVEAIEGESIVLNCEVVPRSQNLRIEWSFADFNVGLPGLQGTGDVGPRPVVPTVLSTESSFRLDRISSGDAGIYTCTATLEGQSANDDAYVTVRQRPVNTVPDFSLQPASPQTLDIGETLQIRCQAINSRGQSLPVEWSKDGRRLTSDGLLVIRSASVANSGTYTCTATVGIERYTSTILVTVRPRTSVLTVEIRPKGIVITEGQSGVIRCNVVGDARSVRWSRPRGVIDPRHGVSTTNVNGDTLTFIRMANNDRGYYYCTAVGADAVTEVRSEPIIVDMIRKSSPVTERPTTTSDQRVNEGDIVRIECRSDGTAAIDNFQWLKNGAPLTDSRFSVNGGVVIIDTAEVRDSGIYVCTINYFNANPSTANTRLTVIPKPINLEEPEIRVEGDDPRSNLLELNEGEQGRLTCVMIAGPDGTSLTWETLDGSNLPFNMRDQRDGVLVVYQALPSNTGTYRCVATTRDGVRNAKDGYVRVNRKVQTTPQPVRPTLPDVNLPARQEVQAGTNIELTCGVSVPGGTGAIPLVYWKNSRGQQLTEKSPYRSVLAFKPVTISQRGEYTCVAEIPGASSSASTFLDVTAEPSGPYGWTENPIVLTKQIGDSVSIDCQPTTDAPTRTSWTREGNEDLPIGAFQSGTVLQFSRLRLADSGTYVCTADSSLGSAVLYAELVVQGPPGTPVVSADSQRLVANGVKTYDTGVRVTLTCLAEGSPSPDYEWSRMLAQGGFKKIENGADIQVLDGVLSSRGSQVVIYNVQPSDAGYYNCTAYNSYGKREVYARLAIRAESSVPTSVSVIGSGEGSNRDLYKPGQAAALRCIATSASPVTYRWTFSNGPLPDNVEEDNAVLRITDLENSNQGTYYCTVTNDAGDSSPAGAQVFVSGVPSAPEPPLALFNRNLGTNVQLTCPLPTGADRIQWMREGGPLPTSARETSGGQVLEIYNLRAEDAGKYYCMASNSVGSSALAEITVIINAETSPSARITDVAEGDKVVLECDMPADAERTEWSRDDNIRLPVQSYISGRILTIPDIRVEDQGVYYCTAFFTSGETSRSRSSLLNVAEVKASTGLESPILGPGQNAMNRHDTGEDVRMTCIVPAELVARWVRQDGQALAAKIYSDSFNSLIIPNVQPEDAGVYLCTAVSDFGESRPLVQTLIVSDSITPEALPTPQISITPEDYKEGQTVNLICNTDVTGATFSWTRASGDSLPENSRTSGPYLRLYEISPEDSGVYTCVISNAGGQRNSVSTRLEVMEEMASAPLTAVVEANGDAIRPGVYQEGKYLELECVANTDSATVTWRPVPPSAYQNGKTLIFPRLEMSHAGTYECVVQSDDQEISLRDTFDVEAEIGSTTTYAWFG